MEDFPSWVQQAQKLPLRFAQVREDPRLDRWVVKRLPKDATVLLIGSGGCTLAALATMPNIRVIHVIDPNPAQLALGKLKVRMLRDCNFEFRLALLGHRRLIPEFRLVELTRFCDDLDIPLITFGPGQEPCEFGLDYSGRYEAVFRRTSKLIAQFPDDVHQLLQCSSPAEQIYWLRSHPEFLPHLSKCFEQVFSLENLVALFGETATQNRALSFSRHFYARTVFALENFAAHTNHFLWQVLAAERKVKPVPYWFDIPCQELAVDITYETELVQTYLAATDIRFDYIHLSNVLDWLTKEEASALLEFTWNQLRPNGYTLIRQLNSKLPIRSLSDRFVWLEQESESLRQRDLSFFYREVHCGQRQ